MTKQKARISCWNQMLLPCHGVCYGRAAKQGNTIMRNGSLPVINGHRQECCGYWRFPPSFLSGRKLGPPLLALYVCVREFLKVVVAVTHITAERWLNLLKRSLFRGTTQSSDFCLRRSNIKHRKLTLTIAAPYGWCWYKTTFEYFSISILAATVYKPK